MYNYSYDQFPTTVNCGMHLYYEPSCYSCQEQSYYNGSSYSYDNYYYQAQSHFQPEFDQPEEFYPMFDGEYNDYSLNTTRKVALLKPTSKPWYPKWMSQGKKQEECEQCVFWMDYFDAQECEILSQPRDESTSMIYHSKGKKAVEETKNGSSKYLNNTVGYQSLPKRIEVQEFKNVSEGIKENDVCMLSQCSHIFHPSCLAFWLSQCNNCCPICRTPIFTVVFNLESYLQYEEPYLWESGEESDEEENSQIDEEENSQIDEEENNQIDEEENNQIDEELHQFLDEELSSDDDEPDFMENLSEEYKYYLLFYSAMYLSEEEIFRKNEEYDSYTDYSEYYCPCCNGDLYAQDEHDSQYDSDLENDEMIREEMEEFEDKYYYAIHQYL